MEAIGRPLGLGRGVDRRLERQARAVVVAEGLLGQTHHRLKRRDIVRRAGRPLHREPRQHFLAGRHDLAEALLLIEGEACLQEGRVPLRLRLRHRRRSPSHRRRGCAGASGPPPNPATSAAGGSETGSDGAPGDRSTRCGRAWGEILLRRRRGQRWSVRLPGPSGPIGLRRLNRRRGLGRPHRRGILDRANLAALGQRHSSRRSGSRTTFVGGGGMTGEDGGLTGAGEESPVRVEGSRVRAARSTGGAGGSGTTDCAGTAARSARRASTRTAGST